METVKIIDQKLSRHGNGPRNVRINPFKRSSKILIYKYCAFYGGTIYKECLHQQTRLDKESSCYIFFVSNFSLLV